MTDLQFFMTSGSFLIAAALAKGALPLLHHVNRHNGWLGHINRPDTVYDPRMSVSLPEGPVRTGGTRINLLIVGLSSVIFLKSRSLSLYSQSFGREVGGKCSHDLNLMQSTDCDLLLDSYF